MTTSLNRKQLLHEFQYSSFLGLPFWQHPVEIVVWEHAMRQMGSFQRIVELGYYQGGMSLLLYLHAVRRKIPYIGFDLIEKPHILTTAFAEVFPMKECLVCGNIFKEQHERVMDSLKGWGKTLLVCDDGDKPLEVKTFGIVLKKDDYLAVHDYGTEIKAEHIDRNRYKMICADITKSLNSMWRFYVVTK